MGSWGVSHFTSSRVEGLVLKGLLCERTEAGEWELPGLEQHCSPWPHPLAPKKALRLSASSEGRTAVLPAASGGVPGEAADPAVEVAPAAAAGGATAASAAAGGTNPTPPSVASVVPTVQGAILPGSHAGEVIDLDADKAEGTVATGGREDAPAAVAGPEAEGTPAPEGAAAAEVVVTEAGASAPITPEGVAPAAEAEGPTGMPLAASAAASVQVPGSLVDPAALGAMVPTSTAASGSAPASTSASSVPRAWRGSVLRWSSRDDPPRHLFALDDATKWHKWQAVQGSIAHVQAALSSALGVLGNTVLPGSQAWRAEAKLQAVTEKACLDLEEFQAVADKACRNAKELQAAAERACRDAEELAQLRGEREALSVETGHLRSQVQGLQSAVSRGADRERELKAQADGEIAKL
nr:tropomyosin-1, isoforms 33/34-like [Setaria viridis]